MADNDKERHSKKKKEDKSDKSNKISNDQKRGIFSSISKRSSSSNKVKEKRRKGASKKSNKTAEIQQRKFVIKAYEKKISALTEELEDTRAMMEEKQKQFEMAMAELKRTQKNFETYKNKVNRDLERAKRENTEKILLEFLDVVDNMIRAKESVDKGDSLEHIKKGISIIMKQFYTKFRSFQVEPIDAVGELFDPTIHEAVALVPSKDHFDGEILAEQQKGYIIGDKLLRVSKVVVAQNPDIPPPDDMKAAVNKRLLATEPSITEENDSEESQETEKAAESSESDDDKKNDKKEKGQEHKKNKSNRKHKEPNTVSDDSKDKYEEKSEG